jgi:hypothetical protein
VNKRIFLNECLEFQGIDDIAKNEGDKLKGNYKLRE